MVVVEVLKKADVTLLIETPQLHDRGPVITVSGCIFECEWKQSHIRGDERISIVFFF